MYVQFGLEQLGIFCIEIPKVEIRASIFVITLLMFLYLCYSANFDEIRYY